MFRSSTPRFVRRQVATVGMIVGSLGCVASAASAQTAGSLALDLTQPRVVSGSAATTALTCTVRSRSYNLRLSGTVDGYSVNGNATVAGYNGPGNYTAKLSFTATGASNIVGGGRSIPVTITATGGSATFSKTATGAKVPKSAGSKVAGTLSWTCPTA